MSTILLTTIAVLAIVSSPVTASDMSCSSKSDCYNKLTEEHPCTIDCTNKECKIVPWMKNCLYCKSEQDCAKSFGSMACGSGGFDCENNGCLCQISDGSSRRPPIPA